MCIRDSVRGNAVTKYNDAVEYWNDAGRQEFLTATPISVDVNGGNFSLAKDVSNTAAFDKLFASDTDPSELLTPNPLDYESASIPLSALSGEQWNPMEVEPHFFKVIMDVNGNIQVLDVRRRFTERRCEWVESGRQSRQVCSWHYFVLQGMCVKLDHSEESWSASDTLHGFTGSTSGIGCYAFGDPNTYIQRSTNLWSVGLYKTATSKIDAPELVTFQAKSDADPALVVSKLTRGSYDFGPSGATKFLIGLLLTSVSSLILSGFCFCLFLQYSWPQANNNSDRVTYFYRRYLRHPHNWCKRCWRSVWSSPDTDEHWDDLNNEGETWTGPGTGGHTLGNEAPQLFDPAHAAPVRQVRIN
eukprot:TRINITY_DN38828_c0_g1_i3.p1 TRINITY_DN38828_c0_g1~~TRINITY_DN38828_c0_g1_i3.p1  ORF type:complete len:358 (+),score=61.97 TRINITY_DN38828_c0_g1_i3:74-1147(+)